MERGSLLIASPPCFPADTPILTKSGLCPISEVQIGTEVWTHRNRWQRVERVGSKLADTVVAKGIGTAGLQATPNHPVYVRDRQRYRSGSRRLVERWSEPEWVSVCELAGRRWAIPTAFACVDIEWPMAPWLVGRWVADGWARPDRCEVMFGIGKEKADEFRARVGVANEYDQGGSVRFTVTRSRELAEWLIRHFGSGAADKTIPAWLLGAHELERTLFLEGYLSGDGHSTGDGAWKSVSVSRSLACGIRLLGTSLQMTASTTKNEPKGSKRIEGRLVNERPWYATTLRPDPKRPSVFRRDDHAWGLVRSVSEGGRCEVFDLQVEIDHSYVADGIVVHNCQAWSMAGQRKGEQDIARVHALTRAIAGAPTHMARNEVRREGAGNQPRSVDEPAPAITTRTDQTEWMSEFPDEDWADPRSRLVTEPIRWIEALRPTFVALEQVPPVLDYWRVVAGYLREWGYSTWAGILSAERYGIVATCPLHDQRPVANAGSRFSPAELATADPAGSESVGEMLGHAENAERRSTFVTALASVAHAGTGIDITETQTAAIESAWTVASLARAALDAAPNATWTESVHSLLSRALGARTTPRGRVDSRWMNGATSTGEWMVDTDENITSLPRRFWADLCEMARSYITSTGTSPTPTPTISGCSSPTATTCTSITQARSRAECSLCADVATPQTRRRAILMASLVGPVHPPQPTHQEYRSGEPAWDHPQMTLEGELLPWVSMAQALGWRSPEVPAPTVTSGGTDTGGAEVFGRGGRERIEKARSWTLRNNTSENAAERRSDEPAPTMFFGQRLNGMTFRANAQDNSATRDSDEPAPTITGGHDTGDRVWTTERPAPTIVGTRRSDEGMIVGRQLPEGEGRNVGGRNWTEGRPATVQGDPRIAEPGWRGRPEDYDEDGNYHGKGQGTNAVRVSIEEASILQSFPPDYPWRGSRTAQFQQIGNAVPPLLARAVLSALTEGHEVTEAIDLFAGPGGWDCGARELGIDPLGLELDDAACATREAAGLRTLQADVSATDPRSVEPATTKEAP